MIKKFFVTLLATTVLLASCKSDDDVKELSVEQRNSLDDQAIEEYLEDHYFHPEKGVLTKFDTIKGNEDDNYQPLKSIAIKDPAGYYYAMRPNVEANGEAITSNDESKILISYDVKQFQSTNDLDTYNNKYASIIGYSSSINSGDGSGVYDPAFYYYKLNETQISNGVGREHVEFEYFNEALKKFKSTNTNGSGLYNFQGVIILPSRLAFGRKRMYTGTSVTENHAYRDVSFIFNFELHKVTPRK
ncbi:hypothetical protein [Faecalibacter rhinopitheci]|uniref:Uncharacterized protein n=1 Tax=Faecalibacter rhinopitheci TaxID=2779678 RepID=A0A8J7FQW4_9FLAO|nr:hypothetical protein [Faecalibacter rhinopitheci]MBF0597894.1 hypothetical protein [Faecalibacter rhinopitheci]MBQ0148705.1 hypothetical protein [Candidatus Onthonaster equi]